MTPLNAPQAPLPMVTADTAMFWHGGGENRLYIHRCRNCTKFMHPPGPICPHCLSRDVKPEAVSGRAILASFTVNHHPWIPGAEIPYVIGLVEIAEQADIRLTTNIVNTPIDEIEIGMNVQVCFEQRADVWLPLFEKAACQ